MIPKDSLARFTLVRGLVREAIAAHQDPWEMADFVMSEWVKRYPDAGPAPDEDEVFEVANSIDDPNPSKN